jgi:hypothetical protein
MVKKARALPLATPSVKRRSRDERLVGPARRAISLPRCGLTKRYPTPKVFGNAQPFAGRRTNEDLGTVRSNEGSSSLFDAIIGDKRVFEKFEGGEPAFARVLYFEISARP